MSDSAAAAIAVGIFVFMGCVLGWGRTFIILLLILIAIQLGKINDKLDHAPPALYDPK